MCSVACDRHCGLPHCTTDPIVASASLVMQLQTIVSRNVNPLDSAVVSIGTINGGAANNVIASEVTLTGSVRTYLPSTRELIIKRMDSIVEHISSLYGVAAKLTWITGYPPLVNDSAAHVNVVMNSARKVVGSNYVVDCNPVMGAEDFSYFLQHRPGCFFFVASSPFECMSGAALPYDNTTTIVEAGGALPVLPLVSGTFDALSNHRPDFDLDERCMIIGASVFVQLITDLLITPPAAPPPTATTTTTTAATAVTAATVTPNTPVKK